MPYTCKGETTTIPAVTGDFCPACGEVLLDRAESSRISKAMRACNKRARTSLVDPELMASVRNNLAKGDANESP
ncbi:MAG: type II toxin-antitoxin system MqsA family antitoxin [Thermodesulfobacteriota bacterium]